MPGPAITRANQVFGSGMNWTTRLRPALGLLSSPTSHAEIGETNIPSVVPARRIAAVAELAMGSPLASQITAQVSSNTAAGRAPKLTGGSRPRRQQRLHRQWAPSNLFQAGRPQTLAKTRAIALPLPPRPRGGTRTATGTPRFVTTTRSTSLLRIRSRMSRHFALNSLALTIRLAAKIPSKLVISDDHN